MFGFHETCCTLRKPFTPKAWSLILKLLIPIVLFFTATIQSTYAAQSYGMEGVVRSNVEIRTQDTRGRDTDTHQVSARFNFPIYRYFGANILASYNNMDIDRNSLDVNQETLAFGLSAIEGEIGRIGLSFANVVNNVEASSDDPEYDVLTFEADYYFRSATIGVDRSEQDNGEGLEDSGYYEADMIWYFSKNFSTSLRLGGLDKRDSYTYRLRFQPRSFANRFNYSLFYTKAPSTDIFGLSFNFFVNSPINMQDRDRNYR